MPKEEWGVKRVCPSCSTRFYDLQRDPMTCPSCGHASSLESLSAGKSRTLVADKSDAKSAPAETEINTDDVVLEEDNDVDLGDDVLEEDEDDNVSFDDLADVAADDEDN